MTRSGPQWHVMRKTVSSAGKTAKFQIGETNRKRARDRHCCKWAGGEHTHTHANTDDTYTHAEGAHSSRQTGRTRSEPGQEIRFLGGFAMGTGLKSTAARGGGRSRRRWQAQGQRGKKHGWRYQAGAGAGLGKWAVWESHFLHSAPSLCDPAVALRQRRRGRRQEEEKVLTCEFTGVCAFLGDTVYRWARDIMFLYHFIQNSCFCCACMCQPDKHGEQEEEKSKRLHTKKRRLCEHTVSLIMMALRGWECLQNNIHEVRGWSIWIWKEPRETKYTHTFTYVLLFSSCRLWTLVCLCGAE